MNTWSLISTDFTMLFLHFLLILFCVFIYISNTWEFVSSDFQTTRISSKIPRYASFSRCLEIGWNTISRVWYTTYMKPSLLCLTYTVFFGSNKRPTLLWNWFSSINGCTRFIKHYQEPMQFKLFMWQLKKVGVHRPTLHYQIFHDFF